MEESPKAIIPTGEIPLLGRNAWLLDHPHPMLGHWPGAVLEKHSLGVNVAMDSKASDTVDWQIYTLLTKDSLFKGSPEQHLSLVATPMNHIYNRTQKRQEW